MKKTLNLRIPLGYRLEDKIEYVDLWQAERYLRSKRIERYTKAVRHGTAAQLHSRWFVCPHCGKRYTANINNLDFIRGPGKCRLHIIKTTKAKIDDWASLQLSLFEQTQSKVLMLAPPIASFGRITCANCGNESYETSATRLVSLHACDKKIAVKCEVVQIDELLSLGWLKANEIKISFPLFEVLTFDFRRGSVYVRVENAQGGILCQRDVSAYPEQLEGGATHKVLTKNKVVLRNVKRLFQEIWGSDLPYSWKQLDLDALFKMTLFVGYPRSFYDCIPYVQNSLHIDDSFRARVKRMHLARNLPEVYQNAGLPQVKSIRRIMFSNPGLFFYINEIKGLWEAIADYNLLSRFLLRDSAYEVLSSIHMRPGILQFINDYCRVKGAVYLLSNLATDWDDVLKQAIDYCCMSSRLQLEMQRRWCSSKNQDEKAISKYVYALPMCRPDERIQDCTINGYEFFWLRNSNDYAIASVQLRNCLRQWRSYQSPVVGVCRQDRYVAAIEVFRGHVVQAKGYDNEPLDADPQLNEAFKKWMARFNLTWGEKEHLEGYHFVGFEEPEEMPF